MREGTGDRHPGSYMLEVLLCMHNVQIAPEEFWRIGEEISRQQTPEGFCEFSFGIDHFL